MAIVAVSTQEKHTWIEQGAREHSSPVDKILSLSVDYNQDHNDRHDRHQQLIR